MTDTALPPEAREAAADPSRVFGKYVLVSKIGKGGMGEVWKAWDTALSRWAAIKFLIPGSSDEDLLRFQREAQAVAGLDHPNIAALYDAGEIDGRRFIAMQFVDGRNLDPTPLPLREAIEAVRDAARGVHAANQKGIIHRDIKPSNLLRDRSGRVFVIDFGIARQTQGAATLTRTGMVIGTPAFMSPEQAAGHELTRRTDVYSLGATLYALATGKSPFPGKSATAILIRVVHHDPIPPRRVRADLPRDVETIILKAMDKDPLRRYVTADLMADDLQRYIDRAPILAHPPSIAYRLRKGVVRHKAVVAATLAGCVAVAITLAILVPKWRSVRAMADSETQAKLKAEEDAAQAKLKAQEHQETMRELNRHWTRLVAAKEWRRQAFRKPADIRAEFAVVEIDVTDFIQRHEEMPQGWYVRAQARLQQGKLDAAEQDLDEAIKLRDDFAPGWALLVRVLWEKDQKPTDFISTFTGGDGDEGWVDTIMVEGKAQKPEDFQSPSESPTKRKLRSAVERWRLLKDSTERWEFAQTREDDVNRTIMEAMLELADKKVDAASRRVTQANRQSASEEYCLWLALHGEPFEDRARWLNDALDIAPHLGQARFFRGIGAFEDGSRTDDDTIADLDEAIEAGWDLAIAHLDRGLARRRKNEIEAAIADFTKVIEMNSQEPIFYYLRGAARLDHGDRKGASLDLEKAIEMAPSRGWRRDAEKLLNKARERGL